MPLITKIDVQHVRVHKRYSLDVSPTVTVITGPNGSGKTTLIEALYIALQGSSFKGRDDDVMRRGAPWYRIDIAFADDTVRTVKFDPSLVSGKKQFVVDGKTQYRMMPRHKYPVILFEPDDLRLLNGSPSRRREYIDKSISQLDVAYAQSLRKYERALKQRNNLLKTQRVASSELFVWDMMLSEYGARIIKQRQEYSMLINDSLSRVYNKIAGLNDTVTIRYPYAHLTQQRLLADLHTSVQKDIYTGFTGVGPHRHDIVFLYNDMPALSVASRGEVRSIMLALKFIEVDILERHIGRKPVILLDDVFSELDASRQKHLIQNFKDHQVIITSATNNAGIQSTHLN